MLVILNCISLRNQNDGMCPNLYFSACRKYVYNTQFWIYTEI